MERLPPEIADLRATARASVDAHLIPRERELSRSHKLAPDVLAVLEAHAQAAGLWQMMDVERNRVVSRTEKDRRMTQRGYSRAVKRPTRS